MQEKILDLVYAARQLCEALNDRPEVIDKDEELREYIEETESALEALSECEDFEDIV